MTVLPLTTAINKIQPFETFLPAGVCGDKPSKVKANQIRAVDKTRLGKLLGQLPAAMLLRVEAALRLHLAL